MIKLIHNPSVIESAGNVPKKIEEYFGRVNSGTEDISIARMNSPAGWEEPGQAILAEKGEWIKYSSPDPGGAQYIAVCIPAFSADTVNRD